MMDFIRRMAAGVLAILHTRAELLAVEIEEEVLRLFSYLVLSLMALVCFGMAVLLAVLLIIVIFWDTNRIVVVACLTGFFALVSVLIASAVRRRYRNKPQFLAATLGEVAKDIEAIRPKGSEGRE